MLYEVPVPLPLPNPSMGMCLQGHCGLHGLLAQGLPVITAKATVARRSPKRGWEVLGRDPPGGREKDVRGPSEEDHGVKGLGGQGAMGRRTGGTGGPWICETQTGLLQDTQP